MEQLGRLIIFVCLFVLCLNPANAAPTPNVLFLINEPVSMLDFGIYNLGLHLDGIKTSSGHRLITTVSYDYDKNRIAVAFINSPSQKVSKKDAKIRCSEGMRTIRSYLGVDENGVGVKDGQSLAADSFKHEGYQSKDRLSDIEAEIDKIIRIEGKLLFSDDGTRHTCRGELLSKEVFHSQSD